MQNRIVKSALQNFHFFGLLLSAKFLLSTQKYGILVFMSLLISVFIIFGLYRISVRFRDTECGGSIKFFHAFLYIFVLYLFGTIISSIVIFIYTQFINKDFLDLSLSVIMKTYESLKIHIDNQTYSVIERLFKPLPYSLLNIFAGLFTATFWSLILAGFVKMDKNIFD
ncbi:MAG: DUF4199 domain-containing protein [Paludibacter sp.]